MKKFLYLAALLTALLLVLSACSPKPPEPAAAAAELEPDYLISEGRLMPAASQEQSFSIPGQVAEVLVKDGEQVKAGQVLARLQPSPEAGAALARALQEKVLAEQALAELEEAAEVNLAQKRLDVIEAQKLVDEAQERYEDDETGENKALLELANATLRHAVDSLAKAENGSGVEPGQREALEARIIAAMASITSGQAAIDALELKASMDGTLVDVELQAGQRVAAGQPVLTLADVSTWVVKTDNLTESEVVEVKVGQAVDVSLDALPGVTLSGEVVRINARFEEKRGDITYTVTIRMEQTDPLMRWGMTAAVQFLP